ncbi:MAG: hypothetical protein U0892_08010 [Pirellulales bacterium]
MLAQHHYPAAFCVAILNSQPMGFLASRNLFKMHATIMPVLGIERVNSSDWENKLEECREEASTVGNALTDAASIEAACFEKRFAVRLGLQMIRGLQSSIGLAIEADRKRADGLFIDTADFTRRMRFGQAVVSRLWLKPEAA